MDRIVCVRRVRDFRGHFTHFARVMCLDSLVPYLSLSRTPAWYDPSQIAVLEDVQTTVGCIPLCHQCIEPTCVAMIFHLAQNHNLNLGRGRSDTIWTCFCIRAVSISDWHKRAMSYSLPMVSPHVSASIASLEYYRMQQNHWRQNRHVYLPIWMA